MLATKNLVSIIIATTALVFASINIATAAEPQCEVDRTINFTLGFSGSGDVNRSKD